VHDLLEVFWNFIIMEGGSGGRNEEQAFAVLLEQK